MKNKQFSFLVTHKQYINQIQNKNSTNSTLIMYIKMKTLFFMFRIRNPTITLYQVFF